MVVVVGVIAIVIGAADAADILRAYAIFPQLHSEFQRCIQMYETYMRRGMEKLRMHFDFDQL